MLVYSIVETSKANGPHLGDYINYLLEHCPLADMSDDELEVLAPWSEEVKIALQNKDCFGVHPNTKRLPYNVLRYKQVVRCCDPYYRKCMCHYLLFGLSLVYK